MSPFIHNAMWPVSDELRPKQRRRVRIADDVLPEILRAYPNVLDELNACPIGIFEGPGRPGIGWDGWRAVCIPLAEALALSGGGEA